MRYLWVAEYRSLGALTWHIEGVFHTRREAASILRILVDIGYTHKTRLTKWRKA